MAATVNIQELNGVTPAYTNASDVKFGTKDMTDPLQAGTAEYHPIPIPDSGTNASYWKSVGLDLTGTFDDIRDIKFYFTDPAWTLGTGGGKKVGNRDTGDIGVPDANYEQATGTLDVTGDPIDDGVDGHTFYNGQTTPLQDWSNWHSGNKGQLDTSFYTGAGKTKHLVLQLLVGPGASASRQTGGQVTFEWQQVD